jgi:hypothetical protein
VLGRIYEKAYHKVSNSVPSDSVSDGKAFSTTTIKREELPLTNVIRFEAKSEVSSSPLQKDRAVRKKDETPYAIAKALGIDRHTAPYAHLLA